MKTVYFDLKMVYTELNIVYGFLFSKEEIITLLNSYEERDKIFNLTSKDVDTVGISFEEYIRDYLNSGFISDVLELDSKDDLEVFDFPCCSELQGEKWIIGKVIKTYKRNLDRCEFCGKYDYCNLCADRFLTEDGANITFDTVRVLNNVVLCNTEQKMDDKIKDFVLQKGKKLFSRISIAPKVPKCYYSLDDCLYCS